jgi:hypothetical protein
MIYANAETAQDIARLLRVMDNEKELSALIVADRLLGKKTLRSEGKGIQITAPRHSGKTTELLRYAEEKNPWGQFVVVCGGYDRQRQIIKQHWEIVNNITQANRVAARLLGKEVEGEGVTPPLMVVPGNLHLLRGHNKPIYVDELGEISNENLMNDLLATGLFRAAVTS